MTKNKKQTPAGGKEQAPADNAGIPPFVSWAEASLEEKVERCNVIVREVSELLADLQKKMVKSDQNFFGHKHMNDLLVGPISQFPAQDERKEDVPRDKRWF